MTRVNPSTTSLLLASRSERRISFLLLLRTSGRHLYFLYITCISLLVLLLPDNQNIFTTENIFFLMVKRDVIFVGDKPDPSRVDEIENIIGRSKPDGGFWTSPYIPRHVSAFIQYERGGLIRNPKDSVWRLTVSNSAHILHIDSVEELEQQPCVVEDRTARDITTLDFETIFSEYDGLYIDGDVAHKKGLSDYYSLAGWDFETVLWNDLSQFTNIEKIGQVNELVSYVD